LFSLYADPRQRRVDVKDILMTARTLGLDEKFDIVFRVLHEVADHSGDALNFEDFLKALTARIVTILSYFRVTHGTKKEEEPTSACTTSKEEENSPLTNLNTSTSNSSTDFQRNNFGKSFTLLEDSTLKPSLSRDSASTSKRSLPQESSLFDLVCPFIYKSILSF